MIWHESSQKSNSNSKNKNIGEVGEKILIVLKISLITSLNVQKLWAGNDILFKYVLLSACRVSDIFFLWFPIGDVLAQPLFSWLKKTCTDIKMKGLILFSAKVA